MGDTQEDRVEVEAMRRAIAQSALGVGTTSPNPPVGCVVLDRGGRVVGEGWHERKGEPHAESRALDAAGGSAAGGTAVVTLEPCCHHGRTPPCHQGLIDAGVRRVVIAVLDPTSRGDGGASLLEKAGVSVEVGLLAPEALLVLGPWMEALQRQRPLVSWLYTANEGGPLAPSAELVDQLRTGFDSVLVGRAFEEGVKGSHGAGAFSLPDLVDDPAGQLDELYATGTRRVLVCEPGVGSRFQEAGLVDDLVVHVPADGSGSWLPEGFELHGVDRVSGPVLLRAESTARRPGSGG